MSSPPFFMEKPVPAPALLGSLPALAHWTEIAGAPRGAHCSRGSGASGIIYQLSPWRTGTVLLIFVPSWKAPNTFLWNEQKNESVGPDDPRQQQAWFGAPFWGQGLMDPQTCLVTAFGVWSEIQVPAAWSPVLPDCRCMCALRAVCCHRAGSQDLQSPRQQSPPRGGTRGIHRQLGTADPAERIRPVWGRWRTGCLASNASTSVPCAKVTGHGPHARLEAPRPILAP